VFKLVLVRFPDKVGAVTGVVGAAGGLGGFFPPLVMGVVKSATGGYAVGFALMALVALGCLSSCCTPSALQGMPTWPGSPLPATPDDQRGQRWTRTTWPGAPRRAVTGGASGAGAPGA
jgi:hypothetical protein